MGSIEVKPVSEFEAEGEKKNYLDLCDRFGNVEMRVRLNYLDGMLATLGSFLGPLDLFRLFRPS